MRGNAGAELPKLLWEVFREMFLVFFQHMGGNINANTMTNKASS